MHNPGHDLIEVRVLVPFYTKVEKVFATNAAGEHQECVILERRTIASLEQAEAHRGCYCPHCNPAQPTAAPANS